MKLYIVRHGQCNSNLNQTYNYKNEDLNETGVAQATALIEKIKNIAPDIIYSSPLLRAKHTAEILNAQNRDIILDNRLRERECGHLEGQPLEIIDRNEYWNYYTKTKYGTEESVPDLFKRVTEFLDDLKNKDHESVLIVAHSGVSKAFYAYFNGIPDDGMFLDLGLKNTELKEYIL